MRRQVLTMMVALLLLTSAPAPAQDVAEPDRPIVYPVPGYEKAFSETERQVKRFETNRREGQRLDRATPSTPERPDLGYDVGSGIEQGAIQKALPR